jgi:hypothetical protein
MPARQATPLRRALDALRRRPKLRPRPARPSRPALERLDGRALLATVTLSDPGGPLTRLILGDDGTFQVEHAGSAAGQVYPPSAEETGPIVLVPGDAGLFIREADGTVVGLNPADHARTAAKVGSPPRPFTVGLHPIRLVASADGRSATLVADNAGDGNTAGNRFTLVQTTTHNPGDAHFRVDDTIFNTGDSAVTLDLFAAADLYLEDDDNGVGYYDAASGAVGGQDQSGQYRIFVQPNPAGGLAPTSYKEGYFRDDIWAVIASGGHFDDTTSPDYFDNGAGLEWRAVTIAPGHSARISYFWSFGDDAPAPVPPGLEAGAKTLDLTAGAAFDGAVATFTSDDPNAKAGDFDVTVSWGDGSPDTTGVVRAIAGGFAVDGRHTYARGGSYTLRITAVSHDGAAGIAYGLARVAGVTAPPPPGFGGGSGGSGGSGSGGSGSGSGGSGSGGSGSGGSDSAGAPTSTDPRGLFVGGLNPGSDTGASSSDGITSDNTPGFQGLGQIGSSVTLAALASDGRLILLGTVPIGNEGYWFLNGSPPLPDGSYMIFAHVEPPSGSGSAFDVALGGLVIDTTPPRIVGLTVRPTTGTMMLSVRDAGGGLDFASLGDASNYTFSRRVQHFGVAVASVARDPADPTLATVQLRTRRIGHGHRWVLTAASGGLRDLAGNALDGEFARRFPTGDGTPGGGFAIQIPTDGFKVLPYRPVIAPHPRGAVAVRRARSG